MSLRARLVVTDDDLPYTFDPLTRKRRRRVMSKQNEPSRKADPCATRKEISEPEVLPASTSNAEKQYEEAVAPLADHPAPEEMEEETIPLSEESLVTQKLAIDMVAEEPVVVCTQRVVASDSGGALGHPKVYINLDPARVHICGYSGTRFVLKKNYNEKTMGPSITYKEYLEQSKRGH